MEALTPAALAAQLQSIQGFQLETAKTAPNKTLFAGMLDSLQRMQRVELQPSTQAREFAALNAYNADQGERLLALGLANETLDHIEHERTRQGTSSSSSTGSSSSSSSSTSSSSASGGAPDYLQMLTYVAAMNMMRGDGGA